MGQRKAEGHHTMVVRGAEGKAGQKGRTAIVTGQTNQCQSIKTALLPLALQLGFYTTLCYELF